jgi:hypothetical protein
MQTFSGGERLSGLVLRHAVLLSRLVSSPRFAASPLSSDLRESLLAVFAASLSAYNARDRLLAEQISLTFEHRSCCILARAEGAATPPLMSGSPRPTLVSVAHAPVSGEGRGAWDAAVRSMEACRDRDGIFLYGRTATLLFGNSSSWAAGLHTPQDDVLESSVLPVSVGAKKGTATARVKGDPAAATVSVTEGHGAAPACVMDGQRLAWRHPLESWGCASSDLDPVDAISGSCGWRIHQCVTWALTGRMSSAMPTTSVGKSALLEFDDDGKPSEKPGKTPQQAQAGTRTRSARSARADDTPGEPRVLVADLFRPPSVAIVARPSALGAVQPCISGVLSWAAVASHRTLPFILDGFADDNLTSALAALCTAVGLEDCLVPDDRQLDSEVAPASPDNLAIVEALKAPATFEASRVVQAFQGSLALCIMKGFVKKLLAVINPSLEAGLSSTTPGAVMNAIIALQAICCDYYRGASWQSAAAELACAAAVSEGALVALECVLPHFPHGSDFPCLSAVVSHQWEHLVLPVIAWLRDRWCLVSSSVALPPSVFCKVHAGTQGCLVPFVGFFRSLLFCM